jgi:ABC-type antimicrobial peptide transport system permease subunit
MVDYLWKSIHRRGIRSLLLLLAVLIVSAAFGLLLSAAQTSKVTVDQDLAKYWRTTYDILVRPTGLKTEIEEVYDLVEPNHLSGIWGGITFEQYEAINSIPGVDVAAPIAMLGYIPGYAYGESMRLPTDPGAYILDQTATTDDGTRKYMAQGFPSRTYYYYDPNWVFEPDEHNRILSQSGVALLDHPSVGGYVIFPLLLAAIDPAQEAALIGLDEALLEGRYLSGDEPFAHDSLIPFDPETGPEKPAINLPILINSANYVSLIHRAELKRVILPPEVSELEDIVKRGGRSYLESLPLEEMGQTEIDGAILHRRVIEVIKSEAIYWGVGGAMSNPSPLQYSEEEFPLEYDGLTLALHPPADQTESLPTRYRSSLDQGEILFNASGFWKIIGVFDIERLPKFEDITLVPLETYFPPTVTLLYDEQQSPVEPRTLRPTLNPNGYIQNPPLVLTTLDAARELVGDSAISAVRIRVADIDRLSPEAQGKIEAVSSEIIETTGLDVDVVVGSSPRRVLVHVPGIGYVEELWIQKGVNLAFNQEIERVNLVFFGLILAVCTLNVLNTGLMTALGRRRETALLKALGWRSSTVFQTTLLEMGLVGLAAGGLGAVLAWGIAQVLSLELPAGRAALIVPLGVALCLLGGLIPAMRAARIPSAVTLREGEVHPGKLSMAGYSLRTLLRRRARTLLVMATMALAAGLLTIFLVATLGLRGYLHGTLLGEYLLLHIESYHYLMAGVCLLVAAITVADALLVSALERRREIGLLKAVGWRSGQVLLLFLREGGLLGSLGGAVGVLFGAGLLLAISVSMPMGAGLAYFIGFIVPAAVGILAAIFPGLIASRIPPAEAMRYE